MSQVRITSQIDLEMLHLADRDFAGARRHQAPAPLEREALTAVLERFRDQARRQVPRFKGDGDHDSPTLELSVAAQKNEYGWISFTLADVDPKNNIAVLLAREPNPEAHPERVGRVGSVRVHFRAKKDALYIFDFAVKSLSGALEYMYQFWEDRGNDDDPFAVHAEHYGSGVTTSQSGHLLVAGVARKDGPAFIKVHSPLMVEWLFFSVKGVEST